MSKSLSQLFSIFKRQNPSNIRIVQESYCQQKSNLLERGPIHSANQIYIEFLFLAHQTVDKQ